MEKLWTSETISGCSQKAAAENTVWYLAGKVTVASHATAQGKRYMAFLGLPLYLVLYLSSSLHMEVLDLRLEKQQRTQITSEPHSYKLNVTDISSTNVLVLGVNTSRKQLRRVHKCQVCYRVPKTALHLSLISNVTFRSWKH